MFGDRPIIKIKNFNKKDLSKLAEFSLIGMNFDRYSSSKVQNRIYAEYVVRDEYSKATIALGAYDDDDNFCGAVFAGFNNEVLIDQGCLNRSYSKVVESIMNIGFDADSGVYDQVNGFMLKELKSKMDFDGELMLFAVDPDTKGQGTGTKLLDALSKRYTGKKIYVFTDTNCSYQFYEHRGFDRCAEAEVHEPGQSADQKMKYFIYNKTL